MKVLVVTAIYPKPGRPEFGTFVHTQVKALVAAGVDVDVLVLDGRRRKLIYPKGIVQLRRWIAARNPDIVHAHYSFVGAVARTQRRVPIVLTCHGSDILGWTDVDGKVPLKARVLAAGGRRLGQMVDAVIVQSDEMAACIHRPDVHVIPHEVDLDTFHMTDRMEARAELGLDADRHYALFAAAPGNSVKNFPLAEKAVRLAQDELPDLELIVVHREPQPRLALYMSACDVLAFPSWQEGSPNIVKQAMACNLPIVATDVGDVRAMIGGTDGCHIVRHEVEPFAHALAAEAWLQRRTSGREAVRHLAIELVAERLIRLYEDVLGTNGNGSMAAREPLAVGG